MGADQMWPGWDTVRTIGSGGFGKVYEIQKTDSTGSYRSALKVISIPKSADEYREYADNGYDDKSITAIFKSQVDDIVSEFKMMSQFKGTSNIVSYEDHMIVPHGDGRGWDVLIRMELLTSLPDYINQYGLTEGQVIQLGQNICHALELCGQRDIIHRDIKPQNIFVNEFGDFKLGDFGIARTMDHTTKATKTGTYSYMAPEVYSGRSYGASVDIYSLGLVLYWLLNERRLPFVPMPPVVPTAAQNNEAQMRRLGGDTIPEPKYGSDALKVAVLKACFFDTAQRFASPKMFRQALNTGRQDQNTIVLSPKFQAESQNINGPSREATDYTTGSWSMKFTPPSRGRKQEQGESTRGAWDDSGSIHWTSDGSHSGRTSFEGYTEYTELKRSTPLGDTADGNPVTEKKAKRWTAKRIAKIAAITITVSIIAELLGGFIGGQMSSSGRGQIDEIYNTTAPSNSGNESQALDRKYIEYTKGSFDGTTYVNEWANLKLVAPEGYYEAMDDFYNGAETNTNLDYGLYLMDQNNHFCIIAYEKLTSASITEKMYLEATVNRIISSYEEAGVSASSDRQYGQFASGLPFTYGHVEFAGNGITVVESMYVQRYGDIMCCIGIVGADRASNDQLMSMFEEFNGYEGTFVAETQDGAYTPYVLVP